MNIFKDALNVGLQLQETKWIEETDKKYHPNFYLYHRVWVNQLRTTICSKFGLRGNIKKRGLPCLKMCFLIN